MRRHTPAIQTLGRKAGGLFFLIGNTLRVRGYRMASGFTTRGDRHVDRGLLLRWIVRVLVHLDGNRCHLGGQAIHRLA